MRVWWCEEHQMPKAAVMQGETICREVLNYRRADDPGCRMVEMQLVPIDALTIAKDEAAEFRRWWCTNPMQPKCAPGGVHPFEDPDMHQHCLWVFVIPSAAADQVGEPG